MNKAGVAQQLWRIEYFASDAVVLRLASVDTIVKLVALAWKEDIHLDVGNHAVTIVSLAFMRLRSYAANVHNLHWKQ